MHLFLYRVTFKHVTDHRFHVTDGLYTVELPQMFRCLRQGRHWKQMQKNPCRMHSSDFILSHCPLVLKYVWDSLLIWIIRRSCALLKSKTFVEWRGESLRRLCVMVLLFCSCCILSTWCLTPSVKFTLHWTHELPWIAFRQELHWNFYELKIK